jgi:magnesium-transporting ATPase (P-type)
LNQFRGFANIYFLVIAVMQSIPSISPLNPVTAILPLFFVVGISMTREAVEDYFRNKSDLKANSTPTKALRNGQFIEVRAD